jgi:hypothetical protein
MGVDNSHSAYIQPTFDELISNFLAQSCQDIGSIDLENPKPEDSDQRGIIKNTDLIKPWLDYHRINANFELWSAEANLKK